MTAQRDTNDDPVPGPDEPFMRWRGRLTHPGATITSITAHETLCISGWIPSGEWWRHCGVCRPAEHGLAESHIIELARHINRADVQRIIDTDEPI